MSRSLFALSFALVVVSGASPAPGLKEKEERNDSKKLEGDWVLESWVQFGQPVEMEATWSFKDGKYTLDQKTNLEEGSIKIDQAKSPPTMDLNITGGRCQGQEQFGIYKVEGDTLTMCFLWPGVSGRPTEFASTADNRYILITLKRKK